MKKLTSSYLVNIILGVLLILTVGATPAHAQYVNMGSLDVKAVSMDGENMEVNDWIINYLAPGEQTEQLLLVSNFSPNPKTLLIYPTDASMEKNGDFLTKNYAEKQTGISKWIKAPVNELILQGGESKIITTAFNIPENAGIGLHTGALMVREVNTLNNGAQNFSVEKGVRVYLNVTGPLIKKSTINKVTSASTGSELVYNVAITNTGTADFEQSLNFTLKDILGNNIFSTELRTTTPPAVTEYSLVSLPKPAFGLYTVSAGDNNETLQTIFFVPLWLLVAILLGVTLFIYNTDEDRLRKTACSLHPANYGKLLKDITGFLKMPEFQRSAAYVCLIAVVFTSIFSHIRLDSDQIKSQLFTASPSCAFDMTVKWGNLRKFAPPEAFRQVWNGKIYSDNATFNINEYLHFERIDQAQLSENKSSIEFRLITGPDNDGMVLSVMPSGTEIPVIKYHNYDTGETVSFPVTDYLDSAGIYPNGLTATYFKTERCIESQLMNKMVELSALGELAATPELMATAEIQATPPAGANIPELENLFIEELPATPEALADLVFNSDYVSKIARQNGSVKIDTDNILLKAFEASPDILEEIAATPDLNFIFIPQEQIMFPPLEFSFTEEKIIRQKMGTLIFVQSKEVDWNAFIGTSDFQLLSGDLRIPASTLTIDPGEPVILGKYKLKDLEEVQDTINGNGSATEDTNDNKDKDKNISNPGQDKKDESLIDDPGEPADNNPANDLNPGQQNKIDVQERKMEVDETDFEKITTGEKRTFAGKFDKASLVDVKASQGEKLIFILRPTLEIRIPAGMPAGTYLGELTITSL